MSTVLEDAFSRAFGEAMGGLVVWITVLVFLTTFAFVMWLFVRSRVGISVLFQREPGPTERPQSGAAAGRPPVRELPRLYPKADPSEDRRRFLATLDSTENVLARILIWLLRLGLLAATAVMVLLWLKYPDDGNRDFMLFYGGAVYFVVALSILAKLAGIRRRLDVRPDPELRDMFTQLRSKVQIDVQSEPHVTKIDAATLERARNHVARGGTLDEACAIMDPRYSEMTGWARDAFRHAVEAALKS